jgi:hypothetical protein
MLAVIEFLLDEKESVGNNHKRMCTVYGTATVDRSTVGHWVKRVTTSQRGKGISMIASLRRGSTYHNQTTGAQSLNDQRKSYWHPPWSRIFKEVREIGSSEHRSLKTQEAITEFNLIVLAHPPHSPRLAPSDFHQFWAQKITIRGTKFEADDDVIRVVRELGCLIGTRHKDTYLTLAQGRRSGRRLCGNIGYEDKPSLFIKCNFHDLGTNIYREKI